MSPLPKPYTALALIIIGILSSSGFLLYDFSQRGTLSISNIEDAVSITLWITWVSLPYLVLGMVGLLMTRARYVSPAVLTTAAAIQVLTGFAFYAYWVIIQAGMMSGLVFISCPLILFVIVLGLPGAMLLWKPWVQSRR
ncbi:MAG: hypothetical protein KZQ58_05610 [gamma proteobacterium symbiont of Bathyaustriella thionipta]|nr:hypothetical protein [gamma proteobacterium symbiont of Bathyaustriella thionipta]